MDVVFAEELVLVDDLLDVVLLDFLVGDEVETARALFASEMSAKLAVELLEAADDELDAEMLVAIEEVVASLLVDRTAEVAFELVGAAEVYVADEEVPSDATVRL